MPTKQHHPLRLADFFVDGTIQYVPVTDLVPSPENPRVRLKDADPIGFDGLRESVRRGLFRPLLVEQPTKEIIDGRQTLDAAIAEGAAEVPVLYLRQLTEDEKVSIRIEMNHHRGHDLIPTLRVQVAKLSAPYRDSVMKIPSVAMILSTGDEGMNQDTKADESKFVCFKIPRMPRDAANRAMEILEKVGTRHKSKLAASLLYVLELWDQNPETFETE